MLKNMSKSEFFKKNGFKMTNAQWSWCGVNEEEKKVMFTAWSHYKDDKKRYIVFSEEWANKGGKLRPGYHDAVKKMNLVIYGNEEGDEELGGKKHKLCIAITEPTFEFTLPMAKPEEEVKIKHVRSTFYFICDVIKEGNIYYAIRKSRIDLT
jgi:hypothetical protein